MSEIIFKMVWIFFWWIFVAEELYDKQQGIGKYKANGGSMPFSKISKNSYYPSFPADLKKKVERYMAEMDRNECECHTR